MAVDIYILVYKMIKYGITMMFWIFTTDLTMTPWLGYFLI